MLATAVGGLIDCCLDFTLSRRDRIRLGLHILNRARGDGNDNPATNGEYNLLHLLRGRFPSASVFFDVGANVGDWSLTLATIQPPEARIYAFEPSRATYRRLEEAAGKSAAGGTVLPFNFALGDIHRTAELYLSGELCGTNSLHVRHAEAVGLRQLATEVVTVRRGDDFCREHGITSIDFLKIDTEGHEIAVLQGFEQLLRKGGIQCLQFEYGATWADSRNLLLDAFDLLLPRGYRIGKIHSGGVEFFDAYDQRQETFFYANYLAVRPEMAEGLRIVD